MALLNEASAGIPRLTTHESRWHPASYIQEAHLLLAPHLSSRGFLSWVFQLNGPLCTVALEAAVDDVVEACPVLRTRLVAGGIGLQQYVAPFAPGVLSHVDLSHHSKRDGLDAAFYDVDATFAGLSAASDSRFRGTLYRVDPRTHVLAMFVAEALVDGDSGSLLAGLLTDAYTARVEERPHRVVAGPAYVDDVRSRAVDPAVVREARSYWGKHPAVTPPAWAFDAAAGSAAPPAFVLPPDEWDAVVAAARRLRTTPYVAVLTSYMLALKRVLRLPRVTVEVAAGDRTGPGSRDSIGSYLSVIRIEAGVRPEQTLGQAAPLVSASLWESLAHRCVPAPLADVWNQSCPASKPRQGIGFFMFDARESPKFPGVRRRRIRPRIDDAEPLRLNCVTAFDGSQRFVCTGSVQSDVLQAIADDTHRELAAAARGSDL